VGTGLVPFTYDDLKDILQSISRKPDLERNLKIFDTGVDLGKKQQG
jgi:hypothetical protein